MTILAWESFGWAVLHSSGERRMSSVVNYFLLQLSIPAGGSQPPDIAIEIITATRCEIKATEACARVAAVAQEWTFCLRARITILFLLLDSYPPPINSLKSYTWRVAQLRLSRRNAR